MGTCNIHCITAYSSMIMNYLRVDVYDKSEEIIHFMGENEMVPYLDNWLVCINTYGQQGKLKEAESVLILMQEAGYSPKIIAYIILITEYGKQADVKAAELVFQRLQSIGLEPDETTYRSMIEGLGKADYYREAMQYYVQLNSKRSGFKPNSSNIYMMINLHARHGDDSDTVQTLEDMRVAGCQHVE